MNFERIQDTGGESEQRAFLRELLLSYGRELGWRPRTTIVFAETLMKRPWKRSSSAALASAAKELEVVFAAIGLRNYLAQMVVESFDHPEEGSVEATLAAPEAYTYAHRN